jgi:hypothetical protein
MKILQIHEGRYSDRTGISAPKKLIDLIGDVRSLESPY